MPTNNRVALGALIRSEADDVGLEVEEVKEGDSVYWKLKDPGPNESANPAHLLADREVLDSLEWDEIVTEFYGQDPVEMAQDYQEHFLHVPGENAGVVLQEDGSWKHRHQ